MMNIYLRDGSIHGEEKKGVQEQKNTTHIGQEQDSEEQEYDTQRDILYC